jgi:hypothetical protein
MHAELSRYREREGADDEAFVSLEHAGGVRTRLRSIPQRRSPSSS